MGSPTKDFVLGFIPLQVARRATDTGGTYDPTGADELNQLQRLIDVGVITGITSPADVKPLEESQGARKPRKTASAEGEVLTQDGELTAQAYMLGNCAHCHNPRGFPSISKPELATLNFLPDDQDGGIFEFSFERMSPVRARGAKADIPIPYITPSLRDYPVANARGTRPPRHRSRASSAATRRRDHLHAEVRIPDRRVRLRRSLSGDTAAISELLRRQDDGIHVRCGALAEPHLPQRRHAGRLFRRLRPVPAHADEHGRLRLPRPAHHGRLDGGAAERTQARSPRAAAGDKGTFRGRPPGGRASRSGQSRAGPGLARYRLRRQSAAVHGGAPRQRSLRAGARRRAGAARRIPSRASATSIARTSSARTSSTRSFRRARSPLPLSSRTRINIS